MSPVGDEDSKTWTGGGLQRTTRDKINQTAYIYLHVETLQTSKHEEYIKMINLLLFLTNFVHKVITVLYYHSLNLQVSSWNMYPRISDSMGYFRGLLQKASKNSPWNTRLLFTVMIISMLCGVSNTQSCNLNADCNPASVDLLNEDFFGLRTLSVSSTCGDDGTTTYRPLSTELDETDYYCNATFPHPKEFMVDFHTESYGIFNISLENPAITTYWQSENTVDPVSAAIRVEFIEFDFADTFLVRVIQIIFISPHTQLDNSDMRPEAMVIERRIVEGGDWLPWRYYARECAEMFPGMCVIQVVIKLFFDQFLLGESIKEFLFYFM